MNKKIDKAALASRILALEGISSEDKSALLELLSEQKRYGLVWEDSPEEVEALLREKLPVLTEDTTKRILSPLGDSEGAVPNHILIEGDNYPALVALQDAYEGKVDVIYIDPPYNTGNKDFVYNDSYVDSEDSYRHSKWLSFMSKRLRIAKRLLSDDGTIFISIDENEVYPLKVLMDEIFSEKNFIGQWNWYKSATPPALSLKLKRNIEYILCYEKNRSSLKYRGIQKTSGSNDPITKPQNSIKELSFPPNTLFFKSDSTYIKAGTYGTAKFPNVLLNDLTVENGKNKNTISFRNRFIWLQSTLDDEIKKGTRFDLSKQLVISYKRSAYDPEVPPNLIDLSVGVDTNEEAGKSLSEIIGNGMFSYPKPVSLLKYLLNFRNSAIILDFFAGSGTTLHATMQLNAEDGGRRQCILVTNNENNICEEVTYERNKRVIQGYMTPKGLQVEGLKNNNLRYYKVDFVEREKTAANQKELMKASTDLLCIKENLYLEETCFEGLKLHPQIARYFTDGKEDGGQMLIIYEPNAIPAIVKRIEQMTVDKENKLKVYVMAEGQYPYTEDFESVLSKVELRAMPHALYQAMRQVLPPPAEAENTEPEMAVSEEEADGSIYKSEEL